eukprot:1541744-Karenia_brevis.AAC.1
MMKKAFGSFSVSQQLAVYARFCVVIAGRHAVYVRPPSEKEDTPILRFSEDDVGSDWLLTPGNKTALG